MTDPSEYDPVEKNFEYLDHTADIQIHAWGGDLRSVYQSCAVGLFNYICPVDNGEFLKQIMKAKKSKQKIPKKNLMPMI